MNNPAQSIVPTRSHHVPALDAIRGFAILWVVLHNCVDMLVAPPTGPFHLIAMLTHPGWIGVQVFFVLSGFLITGNLLDAQGSNNYFASFYARRILRIFPLYYGVLVVSLLIVPLLFGVPQILRPALQHQFWLWTFLANWAHTNLYGFSHFWSLAVEEQFYLFWPLLVYRMPARPLLFVCIGVAVATFVVRSSLALSGVESEALYVSTICRMDALSLGAAAAAAIRIPALRNWLSANLRPLAWAAAALFLVGVPLTRGYATTDLTCETFGYTMLALSATVLVLGTALRGDEHRGLTLRALDNPVLRSLGRYSYAVYVFHVPLHKLVFEPMLVASFGPKVPPVVVVAYAIGVLVLSYALAFCSYYGFEQHFLKLKDRFVPRQSLANQAAAA